jgi:FkbM family methyltransferase
MISFSQIQQDLKVLEFYKNKTNGFFIEIGAYDGVLYSNTYLLERDYGWKGICVEPIPERFEKLVLNRPNSICSDNAVYNESNLEVVFDIAHNEEMLSGISDTIDRHKAAVDINKTQIIVKTISFNDLLERCNAPSFIDYLSLDTEGSELEILKSLNMQKYCFGLIHIEHNGVEPKRTEIRQLLTSNNYDFIGENQIDDCYKYKLL